jgi:hypothetical protein
MNRKSELRLTARRPLVALLGGFLVLAATGCVSYRAHVTVDPMGKLEVEERAELLPGVADSVRLDPKLAWTAFEATTQARGGTFAKDSPDSLAGATSRYPMDEWAELGARGQAFKGFDEIERRTRPANVQRELKDQYFFTVTTLNYNLELTEPSGATVDSAMLAMMPLAKGEFLLTVPGQILKTNAPTKNGNTLSWPLAYGQEIEAEVTYRQVQWVAIVSVILVAGFLLYLVFGGLRAMGAKKKKAAPPAAKPA